MNELLVHNHLKSKAQLLPRQKYLFFVHVDTIWVDTLGGKSWNLNGIAKNEKSKSGVIVEIKVSSWNHDFEENPNNQGKFYCHKTQLLGCKVISL